MVERSVQGWKAKGERSEKGFSFQLGRKTKQKEKKEAKVDFRSRFYCKFRPK